MEQLVDNRYEIVGTLGSGGMADVFLAHDSVLDRDVALKVMNSRYVRDEEFVERFRREAQSAAALSHPNIVSIYDRGESEDGTYYIAMEYLSGGTLKDRILKRGALPPKTAASVAAQIAEALRAAHDRGVVHRDIKPHNILITEAGDIKVTDFGIARAASSSTMTKTGAVMGTAHYISPEQAMGESVGPTSDLYSLGVLLYEMVTGELPFDADTPIGIAMKHVNGTPLPPKEINPEVPAGLNAIVVRLLQKDPNDRYGSDAELTDDLERVARGESPVGAAATQVMGKLDRTKLLGPAAAGAAGTTGAASRTNAMSTPRKDGVRPQKKRRRFLPVLLILLLLALLGVGGYSMLSVMGEPEVVEDPQAPEIDVPDLSGLTFDAAQDRVGERFEITRGDEENSPEEQDTILDQNPSSGGTLAEGSEIEVTTASGSNDVPDTDNLTQQNASQEIRAAGFEVQVEERESDVSEEGRVTSQDPGAGASEEVGSTITITLGSGPNLVSVPNIPYGATQSETESILQDANLTLGEVTEASDNEVAEGGVIDQNPVPDAEVEEGSSVSIVLSSGPEQVEVPSVQGQSLDSATATLSGLGLGYTTIGVESGEPEGTVLSQDPVGGTLINFDQSAIVTLTFSLGPQQQEPVTPSVPDASGSPSTVGEVDTGGSVVVEAPPRGSEQPEDSGEDSPEPQPASPENGGSSDQPSPGGQPETGNQPGAAQPDNRSGRRPDSGNRQRSPQEDAPSVEPVEEDAAEEDEE